MFPPKTKGGVCGLVSVLLSEAFTIESPLPWEKTEKECFHESDPLFS